MKRRTLLPALRSRRGAAERRPEGGASIPPNVTYFPPCFESSLPWQRVQTQVQNRLALSVSRRRLDIRAGAEARRRANPPPPPRALGVSGANVYAR